jgi:hypothetical protein
LAALLPRKRYIIILAIFVVGLLISDLTGCATHGTWYHATASAGHPTSYECQTARKEDEWQIERDGVPFYISPFHVAGGPPGVGVIAIVPANRVVKTLVQALQVTDSSGRELKGDIYLSAISYVGANVIKKKLSPKIFVLSGSKLANKRFPKTSYYFGIKLEKKLPPSFSVVLPRMEINGHNYPSLTIHFTKKPGTYYVTGVNC